MPFWVRFVFFLFLFNSSLGLIYIMFPSTGTLDVQTIYKDREAFARLVREVASPDVAKMGLEILSFTIKVRARECVGASLNLNLM